MSNNGFYLVPENVLRDLLRDSNRLTALECGGVDNWDWYGYSIRGYVDDFIKNNPSLVPCNEDDLEDFGIDEISEIEMADYMTLNEFFDKAVAAVLIE